MSEAEMTYINRKRTKKSPKTRWAFTWLPLASLAFDYGQMNLWTAWSSVFVEGETFFFSRFYHFCPGCGVLCSVNIHLYVEWIEIWEKYAAQLVLSWWNLGWVSWLWFLFLFSVENERVILISVWSLEDCSWSLNRLPVGPFSLIFF